MTQPKRYGTSCAERADGVFVKFEDYAALERERDALRAALNDDDIRRALVAWFDPHHSDQGDFAARMRKAIDAAMTKEAA